MKVSIRNRVTDLGKRIAAVAICVAMVLSVIGPWKAKAASGVKRHIVLVLDTSGASNFYDSTQTTLLYSASSPMAEVKEAATKFVSSLSSSSDDVYISIISYGDSAVKVCDFTNDYATVRSKLQSLGSVGGRKNMTAALTLAKEQFDSVANEGSVTSLILVSPGMVDGGDYVTSGHWSTNDTGGRWQNSNTGVKIVYYSNAAYQRAEEIKAGGTKIYGIGMTKMMDQCPDSVKDVAQLFQNVLRDISSDGCYYPVYDVKDFVFTFGQMAQDIVSGKAGTFKYNSINGGDYTGNYYFEDDYFATSAKKYNPSLATMSLCLAMATFASSEHSRAQQFVNSKDLLLACGFEDIVPNDNFTETPNVDTMGVIIGRKDILTADGEFTLLALATRGAGYGNEWAGNFNVGLTGNHQGFTLAKNEALSHLNWYVDQFGSTFKGTVKIWLTGYSRAAATVNLLAGEISHDRKIGTNGQVSLTTDGIYAYCFETPRGLNTLVVPSATAMSYTNIHNIVNPNDFVPKVAMSEWRFTRYGVTEDVIPSMKTDAHYNNKAAKMMASYSAIGGDTINESIASVSDYENHQSEVFAGIVECAKQVFRAELSRTSGPRSREGWAIVQNAIDAFDDPNGERQKKLWHDWFSGAMTSKIDNSQLDFRDCPGYGMFSNAYDYLKGLAEMRRIQLNYYAGPTSNAVLTDKISKIDLFHVRSYSGDLTTIKGLYNLYDNYDNYTPDYSVKQGEALNNVLNRITHHLNGRSTYYDKIQEGVKAILREYYNSNGAFATVNFHDDDFDIKKALGGNWQILCLAASLAFGTDVSDNAETIYDNLLDYLNDFGLNTSQVLTSSEREKLKEGVAVIVEAVAESVKSKEISDQLLSLIFGYETIPMAHYPELCLAWLQSQDSNYAVGNKKNYVPNAYRTIYINCPVDVVVKDSQGVIVSAFKDDETQDTEGYVLSGVTADGAKRVYLPLNEGYTVTITAREDCTMSFSVNKADLDDVCEYIENYYDISMKKGEVVTVSLPQEFFVDDEGNVSVIEANNVLTTKNGTVEADVILRGDDAREALYTVDVANANEAGGICSGGGDYVLGAYAKVTAAEYEDCEFLGWYEDNELLSTEREYRFRVTGNRQLSAHFEGESQYGQNGVFTATLVAEEGGYVIPNTVIRALDGYPFEVTAVEGFGYEFDGWVADGNCTIVNPNELTTEVILIDENVTLTAKFKKASGDGPIGPDDPVDDTPAHIDGVVVTYRTDSTWTGGYNGSITITNNSGHDITDWAMAFDMNANIAGFWNAEITKAENGRYTVKNGGWNKKIAAGQTITVGFTVAGNTVMSPSNFCVYELKNQAGNAACNAEFKTTSTWNGGCVGEIIITNTSDSALKDWKVTFTCTGHVNSVWNGRILSQSGTTFVVGDDGSHAQIAPGASIRIGVNLNANGSDAYPKDFAVSGK